MIRYSVLGVIGQGSQGSVLKAIDKESGETVALKTLKKVTREISLLQKIHHKNIVRMLSHFNDNNSLVIVMEYSHSDLHSLLRSTYDFTQPTIKYIAREILMGISYIHSQQIIHRDIKPANILLFPGVKIADFGLGRDLIPQISKRKLTHQIMTRNYRAPEILYAARHYSEKIDVWSTACIIAEMFNR
jgi:serine/threonine protein kinase